MVDSRDKGARAELLVRDTLREYTGLKWERVPGSGALNEKHGLKGDLYIPNTNNTYCVEVKHYKESAFNHSLISGKLPILLQWWEQTVRQSQQVDRLPLLIFKHDRSKLFVAFDKFPNTFPSSDYPYAVFFRDGYEFNICMLTDFIIHEKPKFIK